LKNFSTNKVGAPELLCAATQRRLTDPRRSTLHRKAEQWTAEALESQFVEIAESQPERLARHFHHSGSNEMSGRQCGSIVPSFFDRRFRSAAGFILIAEGGILFIPHSEIIQIKRKCELDGPVC